MNAKVFKTLEYYKIIDKLESFSSSPLGKDMCKNLVPSTDINEINSLLAQTNDALSRILAHSSISFSGIYDIRASIMRLEVQSTLNISEFLKTSSLLDVTSRVKSYAKHTRNESMHRNASSDSGEDLETTDDNAFTDSLTPMFSVLAPLTAFNNEIKRCIVSEEEISDDASSALKDIRRKIRLTNEKIRSELNRLVNSQTIRTYLQDFVITTRSGRYCLPVKAEYKSQFPGMVHDQSSTGATIFIEPMAVVKLNNDLKELALSEHAEIEIILANLSFQASEYCFDRGV